jgi:hypothetical protein
MTDKGPFGYINQLSDNCDLEVVAKRSGCDQTLKQIWLTNVGSGPLKNLNIDEFLQTVRPGSKLLIYYNGDPWLWNLATLKTRTTIKELCDRKPEPARVGGPPLTPEFLWFHISNNVFRDIILKRYPGEDAQRRLEQDPGSIPLQPSDELLVPYPIRNRAPAVKVTRSTEATPAVTVETTPEWITKLRALDKRVVSLTDRLRQLKGAAL